MSDSRKAAPRPRARSRLNGASESLVLRLVAEAYRMEGSPGTEAVAHAAGISTGTSWRMLVKALPSPQLKAIERVLGSLGYTLTLVKASRCRVPSPQADA